MLTEEDLEQIRQIVRRSLIIHDTSHEMSGSIYHHINDLNLKEDERNKYLNYRRYSKKHFFETGSLDMLTDLEDLIQQRYSEKVYGTKFVVPWMDLEGKFITKYKKFL